MWIVGAIIHYALALTTAEQGVMNYGPYRITIIPILSLRVTLDG